MDIKNLILSDLTAAANEKNAAFVAKLVPNVDREKILGVYFADLKTISKKYSDNEHIDGFLKELPHYYLEENNLHALMINRENDLDKLVERLREFLPYVDNWSTCDSLRPKALLKHREKAARVFLDYIQSDKPYNIRFGAEMAMTYFLGDNFDIRLAEAVRSVKSEEYYVNMMIAWYFATAMCKNRDYALEVIKSGTLDKFTHNTAIKKSVESFRVSDDDKALLKTLKKK